MFNYLNHNPELVILFILLLFGIGFILIWKTYLPIPTRDEPIRLLTNEIIGYEACWKENNSKHCRKPKNHLDECVFI